MCLLRVPPFPVFIYDINCLGSTLNLYQLSKTVKRRNCAFNAGFQVCVSGYLCYNSGQTGGDVGTILKEDCALDVYCEDLPPSAVPYEVEAAQLGADTWRRELGLDAEVKVGDGVENRKRQKKGGDGMASAAGLLDVVSHR
jgi:hypothetical protein